MRFVLMPMGSAGDVQPLVWLGKVLQGRGHEVVVIVQEMVRDMPERAGLRTVAWGDAAEQEAVLRHPDLWHPRKAMDLLMGYIPKWAEEGLSVVRGVIGEEARGETVLIAGALALAARIVSEADIERGGVPLLTVHLQPTVFMSAEEGTVMMAGWEWFVRAPRWVRAGFMGLGSWMIDRKIGGALGRVRGKVGLPGGRIKGVMRRYWHSPDGVICLFPEWFARKAGDWPEQAVLTRFPLYDERVEREVDGELEAFLAAGGEGDAPVVITPGSANLQAGDFLREAVEACGLLGRRALVLTRFLEQVPAGPAERVRGFAYAPFSRVFPRAAAVVHHGGVGTMAQCLAAGVPQLIMPLAHDQPDNGARVRRMGVGEYVYPGKFKAGKVAEVLGGLMGSAKVREACGVYREKMAAQMTEGEMGALIEGMSGRALERRRGAGSATALR